MRYIIIGAGAVGGTIGGRLHQAGHDVVLVARGEHLERLRSDGLLLVTPEGEHTLDVPAVAGPADLRLTPEDVLVLAVKSQSTGSALLTWADAPVAGGTTAAADLPVVIAQNGVDNERAALRLFRRVQGMSVWLPGTFLEPGRVVAEGAPMSGILTVGCYPAGTDATIEVIARDLRGSRFVAHVESDVMRWKYGKLLDNLANGVDALCGRASEPTDMDLIAQLGKLLREEGRAVLAAAGIAYASEEEMADRRADHVQIRPPAGTRREGSSTWQSLARGTGDVEVDHLNGEIVLLGRMFGVPTPVNEALQAAVRRAAADRRPPGSLSMAELSVLTGV